MFGLVTCLFLCFIYMCVHMYMYVYMYMYVCIYVYMYVCMDVFVCICVYVCIYIYIYIYIHIICAVIKQYIAQIFLCIIINMTFMSQIISEFVLDKSFWRLWYIEIFFIGYGIHAKLCCILMQKQIQKRLKEPPTPTPRKKKIIFWLNGKAEINLYIK